MERDADLKANRKGVDSTNGSPEIEISGARRRLETALAHYGAMLNGTAVGQIELNSTNAVVEANLEAAQIIGTKQSELIGKTIVDFIEPDQRASFLSYLTSARKARAENSCTVSFAGAGGRPVSARVLTATAHRDANAAPLVHMTFMDISGPKHIEQELRAVRDEMEQHEQFERRLGWYQDKLRTVASQLTLTEERERRRIASALHDRISQNLASANMQLGVLLDARMSSEQTGQIGAVRDGIIDVIRNMRDLITELSPPVLHEQSFETALEWVGEHFSRTYGLNVTVSGVADDSLLPEDRRVVLFRGTQELLTNCHRHASAKRIQVRLFQENGHVKITVSDNGIGFEPEKREEQSGIGLFLLRERLQAVGGIIEINSHAGSGTQVTIGVPATPIPAGPTELASGRSTGPDTTSEWRSENNYDRESPQNQSGYYGSSGG
jgi:PAS domain S-box-containing protein